MADIINSLGPFRGATSGTAGTSGAVPAPSAGQQTYVLSGAGTWVPAGGGGGGYSSIQNQGTTLPTETILNFVGASAVAADDPSHSRTNVTFAANLNAIAGLTPSTASLIQGNGSTYVETASFTAGSVLFSNGTSITQDNANFFWDDTLHALKLQTGYTYQFGTLDAFSRYQIWNFASNAVLRLGSLGSDGDPTTTSSEGIVVYGPAVNGTMDSANWGIGRVKVDRLGLLSNVPGGLQDYYFRADPSGMFLQSDGIVKTFTIDRNTGDTVITQPSSVATLNTVLTVTSDPAGAHGHGNHIAIDGNPGGGGTIFRTDGGLNNSVLQLYGGDSTGTKGGALYLNGNNSTSGDAGGVQTTFGLSSSTFDMYDYTQSILLFRLNNSGVLQLPLTTIHSVLATDGSSNVTPIASSTAGYVLTSNGAGSTPTFQAAAAGGTSWSVVTTNTTLAKGNGYFANSASAITFALPATAAIGDTFSISSMNTGLFTISQSAAQSIRLGSVVTTSGAGGSIVNTSIGDGLTIICNVVNTGFQVVPGYLGNFNVT